MLVAASPYLFAAGAIASFVPALRWGVVIAAVFD